MPRDTKLQRQDLVLIARNLKDNKSTCIANREVNGVTKKYLVLKINYYKAH